MQRSTRSATGLGMVLGGALLGMLALTALPWYRSTFGGIVPVGSSVSDLRAVLDFYRSAENGPFADYISTGVAPTFFGWLGFVLLAAATLAAVAGAGVAERTGRVLAAVSAIVAVAGLVLAVLSIRLIGFDRSHAPTVGAHPPTYGDFLRGTGIGAWAMVLAFLLVGVGAVLAAGGREHLRALLADDGDDGDDDEDLIEAGPATAVDERPAADVPGADAIPAPPVAPVGPPAVPARPAPDDDW